MDSVSEYLVLPPPQEEKFENEKKREAPFLKFLSERDVHNFFEYEQQEVAVSFAKQEHFYKRNRCTLISGAQVSITSCKTLRNCSPDP
jgi:hypothetical protein